MAILKHLYSHIWEISASNKNGSYVCCDVKTECEILLNEDPNADVFHLMR